LEAAMKDVVEELKVVSERMSASRSEAAIEKATTLAKDWYQSGLQILKPAAGGAQSLPTTTAVMSKADAVAEAIDLAVEEASAYGFEFRSAAESSVTASRRNLIILATVTGVVCILLSIGIAYSFSRPLQHAMTFSERIAAGDFSSDVGTSRQDEFGRLLGSLATMKDALRMQREAEHSAAEAKE